MTSFRSERGPPGALRYDGQRAIEAGSRPWRHTLRRAWSNADPSIQEPTQDLQRDFAGGNECIEAAEQPFRSRTSVEASDAGLSIRTNGDDTPAPGLHNRALTCALVNPKREGKGKMELRRCVLLISALSLVHCGGRDQSDRPDGSVRPDASSDTNHSDVGTSDDGPAGCEWRWLNDGLQGGYVSDVVFDPRMPGVAYALAGTRLYRSEDEGRTWRLQGESPHAFQQIAFPPGPESTLLAASTSGLLRSTDSGRSWSVLALSGVALSSLLVHPAQPQRLFVGTFGGGILRSVDGGVSWTPTNQGVPYSHVISLGGDPANGDTVIASVIHLNADNGWESTGSVIRTTNGGASWQTVLGGVGRGHRLAICRADPNVAYVALGSGLARSADRGATWSIVSHRDQYVHDVAIAPGPDCNTVYATLDRQGVFRTTDGATTWSGPLTTGMALQPGFQYPEHVAISPTETATLLAATHDGLFRSIDRAEHWTLTEGIQNVAIRQIAVSPAAPSRLWMASFGSGLWVRSGMREPWQRMPATQMPRDWIMSVAADPFVPDRIIVGAAAGGDVWQSLDGGRSFLGPAIPNTNPLAYGFDPSNPANIYVGTQVDGVYRSRDTGTSWERANTGLTPWSTANFIDVRAVLVDATNPRTIFIGTNGRGIYRSDNAGDSWEAVAAELSSYAIRCLIQTPGPSSALYACVEDHGVYRSRDGGTTWTAVNDGLDSLAVTGLAYDAAGGQLFLTTGSGVLRSTTGEQWEPFARACMPTSMVTSPAIVSQEGSRWLVVIGGLGILTHPL